MELGQGARPDARHPDDQGEERHLKRGQGRRPPGEHANDDGQPIYSVGTGGKPPEEDEKDLRDLGAMLQRLRARVEQTPGEVTVTINADKDLRAKVVRDVLVALRAPAFRNKVRAQYYGATSKGD